MLDTFYWIGQYILVLIVYGFVMYVWPSVVFRKLLEGRSRTERFAFCTLGMIALIGNSVILIGVFHLLNVWVVRLLFWGVFFGCIYKRHPITENELARAKAFLSGTYGKKTFFDDVKKWCKTTTVKLGGMTKAFFEGHVFEYGFLIVILLYGVLYFSWTAFCEYTYGFGDMYPHNSWIYGLLQGQIFVSGVYPEGMHCFVYLLHVVSGVRVYSIMLLMPGMHVTAFLVSGFLMVREFTRWKYTPHLTLIAFCTLKLDCINMVYSMSRLQWCLPQDFALFTVFLCGLFFWRYLNSENRVKKIKLHIKRTQEHGFIERTDEDSSHYWDFNLFLFLLSIAASITVHFYPTIMQVFFCVAIALFTLRKVFSKPRFRALLVSAVLGFSIAAIPIGLALLSGIEFEGSIGWAMGVINGTESSDALPEDHDESGAMMISNADVEALKELGYPDRLTTREAQKLGAGVVAYPWFSGTDTYLFTEYYAVFSDGTMVLIDDFRDPIMEFEEDKSFGQKLQDKWTLVTTRVEQLGDYLYIMVQTLIPSVYKDCYRSMYSGKKPDIILILTGIAAAIWLLYRVFSCIAWMYKPIRSRVNVRLLDAYAVFVMAALIFSTMYDPTGGGLPALIAGSRLCTIIEMFNLGVCMVPLDFVLGLFAGLIPGFVTNILGVVASALLLFGIVETGQYHSYLYSEFSRYNASVMMTYRITKEVDRGDFTIVSPTEELYQTIQYGWHEEIAEFLNNTSKRNGKAYSIPTEYVFFFLEKHPIEYAHFNFSSGPKWLGNNEYTEYYHYFTATYPNVSAGSISKDQEKNGGYTFSTKQSVYSNINNRIMVESTLSAFLGEFQRRYPNTLNVYYEDDDFVVYYYKQNTENPYNLAFR